MKVNNADIRKFDPNVAFSRLALKKKAACLYCSRRRIKVCCFHVGKGSKSLKSLTKRI